MPYFDHNATTPLLPAARDAWLRASDEAWANPSSPYRMSARVHRLLDAARERVAAHVGASSEEIVFTSGATEANNAVLRWFARILPDPAKPIMSPTEHPSVLEPARELFGSRLVIGSSAADLPAHLASAAAVPGVAWMAANNETGLLAQPSAIAGLCRERGAWYLCDAAQWIGRMPARDLAPGAFLVACAHKFGGPKGFGFLRVPAAARQAGFRMQRGGEQEHAQRAGTENYPAIAAMLAALDHAAAQYDSIEARTRWRERFIADITAGLPGAIVNTGNAPCLWNTVSLRMPRHENTRWVVRLDKLGFEISSGSACATGAARPSHVLAALGLTPDEARRTVRISAGWETTERDWQLLAEAIVNVWEQLQLEDETGSVIRP